MQPTTGQFLEFIIKCFNVEPILSGTGFMQHAAVVCPFCASKSPDSNFNKKKLAIRLNDHLVKCWVCAYTSSNLYDIIRRSKPEHLEEYKTKFKIDSVQFTREPELNLSHILESNLLGTTSGISIKKTEKLELPSSFILIAPNLGKGIREVEEAWIYLQRRNVSFQELWYWKMGVLKKTRELIPEYLGYYDRIIIPSFNSNGDLNYFNARAFTKKYNRKYTNPKIPRENIVFNECNIDWSKEVTLVEGVFDLIKCNTNATCLLGSSLESNHLIFKRIVEKETPVLLALDSDMKDKTYKIAKMLVEYGIKVRVFQLPSGVHDVGELKSPRDFSFLAANSQEYSNKKHDFYRLFE